MDVYPNIHVNIKTRVCANVQDDLLAVVFALPLILSLCFIVLLPTETDLKSMFTTCISSFEYVAKIRR